MLGIFVRAGISGTRRVAGRPRNVYPAWTVAAKNIFGMVGGMRATVKLQGLVAS